MRTKNSDWVVDQALSALFSQRDVQFKLLVVDSGSTDRTLEILKDYPCKLIEVSADSYIPGKILNMAIEQIDSSLIVFLNSDSVLLSPYSLKNLLSRFDHSDIAAAYGRQIPRPEAELWVQRDYAISFPDDEVDIDWLGISLPLAAIKRKVWDEHHFYCDAWASEDTEWGLWAKNHGYVVAYVPSAITMHSHNYSLKQLYGRRFVEGEANVFISGEQPTKLSLPINIVKQIIKDIWLYLKHGQLSKVLHLIQHSFVYQWAYYQGLQLGTQRKEKGDTDLSKGQKIIFSHYDA